VVLADGIITITCGVNGCGLGVYESQCRWQHKRAAACNKVLVELARVMAGKRESREPTCCPVPQVSAGSHRVGLLFPLPGRGFSSICTASSCAWLLSDTSIGQGFVESGTVDVFKSSWNRNIIRCKWSWQEEDRRGARGRFRRVVRSSHHNFSAASVLSSSFHPEGVKNGRCVRSRPSQNIFIFYGRAVFLGNQLPFRPFLHATGTLRNPAKFTALISDQLKCHRSYRTHGNTLPCGVQTCQL